MYERNTSTHGKAVNTPIAGRYIHPDCGSAANGTPAIEEGFHAGMWPPANDFPRKQKFGSHNARTSGCWVDNRPPNTNPCRTISTDATINAGPAIAASVRPAVDSRVTRLTAEVAPAAFVFAR